ncbi:MAG: hypothetical protein KatS3mg121_0247 [Gammaproteobacteria bacterium]|nr:MAG: hypothetical protein KatS3mg121_0247 [Gammaproteobacteria bacterium]
MARLGEALAALAKGLAAHPGEAPAEWQQLAERCTELAGNLALWRAPEADWIRWYETGGAGFALHATPAQPGAVFAEHRAHYGRAWVFTSATLAVAGDFGHFARSMGLEGAEGLCFESPFDYRRQALLYLPPGLPEPSDPRHTTSLLEAVLPVLEASGGRAFLLFTSHRALQAAAAWLRGRVPYPLFVQGQAPRSPLLDAFRLSGNGVLLGTASFWEGVDIRGEALSCVVIDKLPFAAPNDPVLEARIARLREAGEDPFTGLQLPRAVLTLKQGIGRLIRGVEDRGVLVIGDPRLRTRGYGRVFLDSLPPMPVSEALADVRAFFATTG